MFTGIIRDIGEIVNINQTGANLKVEIVTRLDNKNLAIGASIACNGVCLTVTSYNNSRFTADISSETINKTNIKNWKIGSKINLEPSLRLGDDLSGHIVLGHVDNISNIIAIKPVGDSKEFTLSLPKELHKYIAYKGSICINGISLTVNEVSEDRFKVMIIPHTLQQTNLQFAQHDDEVNIEIDTLARYTVNHLANINDKIYGKLS